MPLTNSVIRRYTPPTCTLQIVDRNSPLSRWVGRSATSLLQFELRFDDPRLPEEKRVSIQGDRYQLEALHEAVTNYIQDLLNQPPDKFNTLLQDQASIASNSPAPDLDLTAPQNLMEPRQQPLETSFEPNLKENSPTNTSNQGIFLQPGKRLTHRLFLGALATEATGAMIQLSLLQLFDLATALDEYAIDVVALPALKRSNRATTAPSGTWAGIAAVLVLSVGITAVVMQLLNRSNEEPQIASRSNVADPNVSPQPSPSLPATPPSSLGTLPPLPPTDSTNPASNPNLPGVTVPGTLPTIPNAPQANLPPTPPNPGTPQANAPQTNPANPLTSLTPPPSVLVNPVPRQDGSASTPQQSNTRSPNFSISNVPDTIPRSLPQLSSPERANSTASSAANRDDTASTPESSTNLTREQRLRTALENQSSSNQNAPDNSKPTTVAAASAAGSQIAQAREFFQKNWQPPSNLKQTLEYSIVLDVDGTIQRIEPLGQASRTYVDRSGMPLIGEPFVSPNRTGQTPRIRVVLSPDGKVQAFEETE